MCETEENHYRNIYVYLVSILLWLLILYINFKTSIVQFNHNGKSFGNDLKKGCKRFQLWTVVLETCGMLRGSWECPMNCPNGFMYCSYFVLHSLATIKILSKVHSEKNFAYKNFMSKPCSKTTLLSKLKLSTIILII